MNFRQLIIRMNPGGMAAFPAEVPWYKIVMWTILFQIGWFWNLFPDLLSYGAMQDTDDYQRLAQVRSWMAGQSWFDVTNYRMDPPFGADMHWSRLVDVPIAALIWFFDLFVDQQLAERLAAIVWPAMLLVAAVFVMLAICRRLDSAINPLLALLFSVTCITALTEFRPGRIDHHSVQILLFLTMLLGLVSPKSRWGHYLVGLAIAASISVGLDAIMLIVVALAWLGLEWAIGRDVDARGLVRTGIALWIATPVMFFVTVAPGNWLVARCDQISAVYVLALFLVGGMFFTLASFGKRFSVMSSDVPFGTMAAARFMSGVVLAALCAAFVVALYPQCMAGPLGSVGPELASRWLVKVQEAMGLAEYLTLMPQIWISVFGYGILVLAVSAFVLKSRSRVTPEFQVLFVMLAVSLLGGFVQYRALRIGIFASIPFCVVFWQLLWNYLKDKWRDSVSRAAFVQICATALLISPTWLALSSVLASNEDDHFPVFSAVASPDNKADWKLTKPDLICNRQSDFASLAALPKSYVMTDINSGPATVIFTSHDVVGGPYHRNERAILDMVDFFSTDLEAPERIARARSIEYVAYCEPSAPLNETEKAGDSLLSHIIGGTEPAWLRRVSANGDRLHVFKVELD